MLEIYIHNLNGKPVSNYEYIVMVNADKIAGGKVIGHKRSDGWIPLVKRICEQEEAK
jgi:hypothetical protein